MGKITVETCHIDGLKVITPQVFGDARGYFMETYNYNDFKAAGIDVEFVQDEYQDDFRQAYVKQFIGHINNIKKDNTDYDSMAKRRELIRNSLKSH